MKVICNKNQLTEAINTVSKAVSVRSVITVLEGICIKTISDTSIKLIGNDLEIGIECTIEAQVLDHGDIVLNAKLFGDIVRKMAGETITLDVSENNLTTITSGYSKFEILGIKADEFPDLPSVDAESIFKIKKTELKKMITNTIFSVGTSENKIVLTGCLLEVEDENVKMVAIDGFRLAIQNAFIENNNISFSLIIPSKTLNELNKIIKDDEDTLEISYTKKHAIFIFDNCRMVTRLIEGEYVNYKQIISTVSTLEIQVETKELIHSVERASLVITNENNKNAIRLKIKDNNINVSCETTAGKVDDNIKADTHDKELEIGFNHKFLIDALKACTHDEIILKFSENIAPCVIVPTEGEEFLYLILPVRLKTE